MRNKFLFIVAILGMVLTASCSKDDDDNGSDKPNVTQIGNAERPTDWVLIDDFLENTAMQIILAGESLPEGAGENDLIAAFTDNECVGVATPLQYNGDYVFLLQVVKAVANEDKTVAVTLRYYSSARKTIYTSEPINYIDMGILGSVKNPYQPMWVTEE